MKITINTQQEAVALSSALLEYVKAGLTVSGALVQRRNEDPYYTELREFLRALEKCLEHRK